jgi:hypothetical protein
MKIYIAGRFDDRNRLRDHKAELERRGHQVIASWLHEGVRPELIAPEQFLHGIAITDTVEVRLSDCFILDTLYPVGERGGRENEFGLVMDNLYVLKIIVGPYRTAFHRLANMNFRDWDGLLAWFPANNKDSVEACLASTGYGVKKEVA